MNNTVSNTPVIGNLSKSKYIKTSRDVKIYEAITWLFLFVFYVLPQYFGFHLGIDFSAQRIMLILVLLLILSSKANSEKFFYMIPRIKQTPLIGLYLFVTFYTMVLRADFSAFLNPFIEFLTFFVLLFLIKEQFGVEKTIKWITGFIYFLLIMGIIEYLNGESLFAKLETLSGLYTGTFVRSGSYRIMGPAIHSLGYGLMLITMTPFVVFDSETNSITFLKRKFLLILLIANVFLCGSRSTLGVFFVEIIVLFLFSSSKHKKRFLSGFLPVFFIFAIFVFLTKNFGIGKYVMLQLTSIIDEIFGTSYSVAYGADTQLGNSSNYRSQLYYIFTLDWLNPLIGIGRKRVFSCEINGSYVYSVDNYYICEYIRYAYPGLISYILIIIGFVKEEIKKLINYKKDAYTIVFLTGTICAFINLQWIDSLMNLKYIYLLFALALCRNLYSIPLIKKEKKDITGKKDTKSKYIKKSVLR